MNKKFSTSLTLTALLALGTAGCASDDPIDDEFSDFSSGKADSIFPNGSPEAQAVLSLVNDPSVDFEELDDDARLHKTAARNIIEHRDGADELPGTGDDDLYDDLDELDAISFVGPTALARLLEYAIDQGHLGPSGDSNASVIFSPQDLDNSHNARVAQLIDEAQDTVDIAMYSYSSAAIADAIEAAVARGVDVRFIFETARAKDKHLSGLSLENSKSGRLEKAGVNVRFVNKIMHHKMVIVDGPRDDIATADRTKIASGSANWSTGGATIYDENTVFLSDVPEMALKLQREYDLMWDHSRDIVIDSSLPLTTSSLQILDSDIPDNPDLDVYFTSDNFDIVGADQTTFRLRSRQDMAVSDKWVEAIEDATDSIWLAHGHMRLRPVAEALIAKKQANPNMDIRVYVDQQEYISFTGNNNQISKREDCVANATTANKLFDCENKSFLWAKAIGEAGIETHYKYYAYRWHFSYAVQMHNKFMIVDGDELYTGSYNLSVNAEHSTFENVMHFKAPTFGNLVQTYEGYFEDVFETGRGGSELQDLRDEISTANSIPLVFDSIALTYDEATSLKSLIRSNCTQVNSADFRSNPQSHKFCPR
jgi:phosphatidylserine/phosphatidylglycerophosphate/cardiolipin synthase-like enzyme